MVHERAGMRLILCLLATAALSGAQEPPAFQSDVSLVHVDAEVADGTRILTGLEKDDFLIKDAGQVQKILYFSQDEEPLDVILLFDISGSMRPKVAKVGASAHAALAELHRGDRVAIMTFQVHSSIVLPFTDDLDAVERSIQEDVIAGKFRGGTHILAGVDDAAKYFLEQRQTRRRRAVLILTDDIGQRSRRTSTVVHRLWEADALLSGLIIRSPADRALQITSAITNPLAYQFMREGMDGVAEKSGGEAIQAGDPGGAFREMMQRVRRRYSLYYLMPPGKPGEERSVKVELAAQTLNRFPAARVRARKGYMVPAILK